MLQCSRSIGLIAGVASLLLAAQAVPARAATVEFLAGPLNLLHGQLAEVFYQDPNEFPCRVGVQILVGQPSGRTAFAMTPVVNTISDPEIVPAGRGLVVGIGNPDIVPAGERRMVQARVRCSCPGVAASVLRTGLAVSFAIRDATSGRTEAVVLGFAR